MFGFDWNSQSHKFGCFSVIYLFFLFLWIIFIYFKSPDTTFIQVTVHHFFSLIFNPNLNYSDIPPPVFFFFLLYSFLVFQLERQQGLFNETVLVNSFVFVLIDFFTFIFLLQLFFFFFLNTHFHHNILLNL